MNLSTPESRLAARCAPNPFEAECIEKFADARDLVIIGCVEDATLTPELCGTATTFVCEGDTNDTEDTGNPFAPLCQTDANSDTYDSARTSTISTCIDPSGDIASQFCVNAIEVTCVDDAGRTANPVLCAGFETDQTIVDACDSDIFNSACDANPTYIGQRNAFCATSASDSRCTAVISNVCTFTPSTDDNNDNSTGNPFAALCQTGTTYETPRNDIITACTTDLRGRLCTNATTFACTANPFHVLCYDSSATAFQTARRTAVANCGDGTTTITEQICADAVEQTCEGASANVFNTLCNVYSGQPAQTTACSDNDAATRCYLQEQIDACADGREVERCAQVGTGDISTCTADPFAAACVADGSTFAPYLADAQAKRYDYCGAEGVSDTDPICTSYRACDTALNGGTTVPAGCGTSFDADLVAICAATPFNTQCGDAIFNDDKQAFCMINTGGVNNLFHANCTAEYRDDTARNSFCEDNPFHAGCESNVAYADEREENCAGDTPDAKCVTPGLYATSHPVPIPTSTSDLKFPDSFLSSVTLNDDGITLETIEAFVTIPDPNAEPGADPVPMIREARTATVTGDVIIGRRGGAGTAEDPNTNPDGYAIFKLVRQGVVAEAMRTSQHAAILSTTNLGAPLSEAPTIAIWPGHFSTKTNPAQTAVDFYIDFVTKKIGFINTARDGIGVDVVGGTDDRPAATRAPGIHLNVDFDTNGYMGGFASLDDNRGNNALRVFGLIGQEGFVAVFVDLVNQPRNFGAITASNPSHPDYVAPVVELDVSVENRDADTDAGKVNYSDWVGSFDPQTTLSSPRESEILQTTTFTDKTRGFASLATGTAKVRDFSNHNFFRSRLLRGDAKNGLVLRAHEGNYYAGILNTADLGAPITTVAGEAVWRAFLFVQDTPTGGEIRKAFDLDIIFASGDITGPVRDDIKNTKSARIFNINGKFNAQGVITGSITRAAGQVNVPLSGIIGQDGAIAVFASNVADNKFAGGFIAVPHQVQDVTYRNIWLATHEAGRGELFPTPQESNHWLQGGVTSTNPALVVNGQSIAGITNFNPAHGGALSLGTGFWRLAKLTGQAADGVAYYSGVREGVRYFYSGVTSGTDLGRPLTNTSGELEWVGQLSVRQNNGRAIVTNYGDILLTLNFSGTGGVIIGDLPAHKITSPGYRYAIRGWFNADGFVDGNVFTISGASGQFTDTGKLSGLIGQQGIVGAFHSNKVAGGFVATPHRPSKVGSKYEDYLHYAQKRGHAVTNVPHGESDRWNELLLTDTTDPNHNIAWGHIQQNRGAERDAFSVAGALSAIEHTPNANFTGGFSYLAGYWGDNGLNAFEDRSNINRAYHAAIHPNVNVGAPLGPNNHLGKPTLTWWGYFVAHQNKTFDAGVTTSARVPFLVNYGSKTISVDYRRNGNSALIGGIYSISEENGLYNVPWDDWGVLNGEIRHKDSHIPDGKLTGLIGQYGLVAVFVSDADTGTKPHYGYAGGFVACPTVQINGVGGCR